MISPFRSNFLKTMLRLATTMDEIPVVADQRGSPTDARDLAQALQRIVLNMVDKSGSASGVYHFANDGEASWAELAAAIMEEAANAGLPFARINPIGSDEYPTRAARPVDSRLSTAKLVRDYAVATRNWRHALRGIVDRIAAESSAENQR